MVLLYSVRVSRVPTYSGYPPLLNNFTYGTVTPFRPPFQVCSVTVYLVFAGPLPHTYCYIWFGLFRFRSPLLSESLSYFLFLRVLRCFSSPGSLHYTIYSCNDNAALPALSSLIRISADHCLFAAPRSFSQLVTSFLGAMYQGIHLYALCSLIYFVYISSNTNSYLTRLINDLAFGLTFVMRLKFSYLTFHFLAFFSS